MWILAVVPPLKMKREYFLEMKTSRPAHTNSAMKQPVVESLQMKVGNLEKCMAEQLRTIRVILELIKECELTTMDKVRMSTIASTSKSTKSFTQTKQ